MADTTLPGVLLKGTAAARPAASAVAKGTVYSATDTGAITQSDGSSWSTWATISSGLSDPMTTRGDIIVRNASNTTDRLAKGAADTYLGSDGTDVGYSAVTDAKLSTSDITTNNASTSKHGFLKKLDNDSTHFMDGTGAWSVPGGGSSRPYIDTITLDGTYGDDFTGAMPGIWTRRTVTSGEETTGTGGSTWLDVDFSSGAASRLYLQTAPAGDFELIWCGSQYISGTGSMTGPVIIDSTGAGVACFIYDSALAVYLGVLSGYAYSSFPTTLVLADSQYRGESKYWLGLKKSGTNYSVRYSFNGYVWSPYSSTSSQSFTVDRIGWGRVFGTPTTHRASIDRFNKI